jgi:hypothetical protein
MGRKRKLEEKTLSSSQPTKKVVGILEPIKEKIRAYGKHGFLVIPDLMYDWIYIIHRKTVRDS